MNLRLIAGLLLLGSTTGFPAIVITNTPIRPTENVLVENPNNDLSGLSVRWRSSGNDTDAGQTFTVSGALQGYTLQAVTVRIGQGQDGSLNSNAPGLPLVFDFYEFDSLFFTLTPLFRETGNLPLSTQAADFITFDLSPLNIELETGKSYAFFVGANVEDPSGSAELNRFRLAASGSDTVPGGFEIRREYEFGESRPALADQPNIFNTNRDLLYIVHAIPEPSAAMLVVLSGGIALCRRRRSMPPRDR